MKSTSTAVSITLVEARKRTELSQRQLARLLRRAHSYVAKIETGARRVEVLEFCTIANTLAIHPCALLAAVLKRRAAAEVSHG